MTLGTPLVLQFSRQWALTHPEQKPATLWSLIRTRVGNLHLVKLLVENGADLQVLDLKGRTALGRATTLNPRAKPDANIEVIEWLWTKTYEQAVDRYFRANYDHHFAAKGALNISKR